MILQNCLRVSKMLKYKIGICFLMINKTSIGIKFLFMIVIVHSFETCTIVEPILKHQDGRFSSAELSNVPYADDNGLVIDTRLLEIEGLPFTGAYNPSIEKVGTRYLITFRIDDIGQALIGTVLYDKDFMQKSSPKFFDFGDSLLPHDSRLFYFNKQLVCLYSHAFFKNLKSINPAFSPPWHLLTGIRQTLVLLDHNIQINKRIELLYGEPFEKNWTPFSCKDKKGKNNLYFIYKFNPHQVLHLNEDGQITKIIGPSSVPVLEELWEQKWGKIRGGTPAKLIDDEYLTFFHSFFSVDNKRFYVFGALTFEKHPPFSVTKISKYPIIFHECYSATNRFAKPWGETNIKYVIFPGGFVTRNVQGRDVFILACGENDRAIRIVTLDKNKLMLSLKKICH